MVIITQDMIKQFQTLMESSDEPLKVTFQNLHQGYPTEILDRFLKARDGNVLKAHNMLIDCLKWRIENEIDNILSKPIIPAEFYRSVRDSQLIGMSGYTKDGRPVIAIGAGPSTHDKASPSATKKFERHTSTCVKVLDMTGLKLSHLNQIKQQFVIESMEKHAMHPLLDKEMIEALEELVLIYHSKTVIKNPWSQEEVHCPDRIIEEGMIDHKLQSPRSKKHHQIEMGMETNKERVELGMGTNTLRGIEHTEYEMPYLEVASKYFEDDPDILLPTNVEGRLNKRLSYFGFNKIEVQQDDQTLYRVFSHQLLGMEKYHYLIRHAVAEQLRDKPLWYKAYVKGDYKTYCNLVASGRPADNLCIMVACDLFGVRFVELRGDANVIMTELNPTHKLQDEKPFIYRKGIYSSKCNAERHSMVLNSDQHLNVDSPNVHEKVDKLKQHLHAPKAFLDICRSLLEDQPEIVVPESHEHKQILSERLRTYDFQMKKMTGDGNCCYRSLGDQILNNQECHPFMRSVIVAKLKEHPSRYSSLRSITSRESEDYDNYCSRMASLKEWGDIACIQAACDAFRVKIILLFPYSTIFMEFEPDGPCKKVIYGVIGGQHMDVMLPLAVTVVT